MILVVSTCRRMDGGRLSEEKQVVGRFFLASYCSDETLAAELNVKLFKIIFYKDSTMKGSATSSLVCKFC